MEFLVYYEYLLILFIAVSIAIAGIIFELRTLYVAHRTKKIDLLLATLFSEKIEQIDLFFPKKYRTLPIIVPAIEKMQKKITSPYWIFFKEHVLHRLVENQIELSLKSTSWKKTTFGLRALQLSPLPVFQESVLSFLADSNDIVRFQAIKTAIALNTYIATKQIIQTMIDMPPVIQFPYRDALSKAPQSVHEFILQMYRSTKNEREKIGCLQILSVKAGLLTEEDIVQCITSSSQNIKWWGLFALTNNPYEKGLELLIQELTSSSWPLQAIATYILGSLEYKKAAEKIVPLLSNERYWVRYTAAVALRFLGASGKSLLEKARESENDLTKNIATYMLALPEHEFQKGIKFFFPLNLDAVFLNEEYTNN